METMMICMAGFAVAMGVAANAVAGNSSLAPLTYLKQPTLEQIGPAHLLADAATASQADLTSPTTLQGEARGLLDYTQTLIEGEELMFVMDVPYIPAQDTPIVLAQAAAPGAVATPQPDYILNTCKETESTGDPRSAMRAVNPAGWLAAYIENHSQRLIDSATEATIKTTLLEGTKHGNLVAGTSTAGRTAYRYDPTPDYIGNDRALFRAEFEGKVYKIVVELHVFRGGVPGDFGASTCPPPNSSRSTASLCPVHPVTT